MPGAAAPAPTAIAGYPAAWSRIDIDVRRETGDAAHRLPCDPIALYTLSDPARSIDAEALLREAVIPDPPYWALVWTGARAIAATVATLSLPASARVLDLGCGLGLSGLAAAQRGAAVTFGDYLEAPLEFVRATLARSATAGCSVRTIDFTGGHDDGARYDLILAADIVYDPAHYVPLAAFLDRHLSPGGAILLTESLRADASVFVEGLLARGFEDEKSSLWVAEDGRRERTWLHTLRRSCEGPASREIGV